MTYVSRTGPYVPNLGNFDTFAELLATHPATLYNPGTTAYAADQGIVVSNGSVWEDVGEGGSTALTATTYAAARLISGVSTGDRLQVLGRTSQSDGGQGLFTWVAGGSTTINDGSQLTAPGGIWQRTPDQLYTPQIFGAVGDGVTDDTAALQRAIAGLANGQALTCLPNSTYAIGAVGIHFTSLSNLDVNFNGAHFVSLATSTQDDNVGGKVAILFTSCVNCKIHGGNFDGQTFKGGFLALTGCTDCEVYSNYSTNVGNTSPYQFGSNNSTRTRWHDNVASTPQAGGAGVRGFWLGNSNVGFIDTDTICGPNNKAISNTATGFVFEAAGAQVFGNYALNNAGSGFISSTATGSQSVDHNFVGNTAIGSAFHGYQTDVVNSVPVLRVTLSGNRFEGNVNSAVYLNLAQQFTVTGNIFVGNNTSNTAAATVLLSNSSAISICDNVFRLLNTENAVNLSAAGAVVSDISVCGNDISNATAASGVGVAAVVSGGASNIQRLIIANNTIFSIGTGIDIRALTAGDVINDVAVMGNTVFGVTSFFVRFTGATANQITNARTIGNSGGTNGLSLTNTTPIENFGNTSKVRYSFY